MAERRLLRKGDLSIFTGSTTLVIPVGGGCVSKTFNISGPSKIEMIVNVRITDTDPKRCDIYAPQAWHVTGTSVVGISAGGLTGTTVTVSADVLGY